MAEHVQLKGSPPSRPPTLRESCVWPAADAGARGGEAWLLVAGEPLLPAEPPFGPTLQVLGRGTACSAFDDAKKLSMSG